MRTEGAISIVEAAYRLDLDQDQWLEGVAAEAKRTFGRDALSVYATIYDLQETGIEVARTIMSPDHPELLEAIEQVQAKAPPEVVMKMYRSTGCDSLSSFNRRMGIDPAIQHALFAERLHALGVHDSAWVQGVDSTNRMVSFVISLARETAMHPRVKNSWERISVHMAAGLRLRDALTGPVLGDGAEAIFDASHKCVHATGDARDPTAQERLRKAARAVDRARSRGTETEEALDLWQGLFVGRWTVADTFDSDGRRLFVAMRNEPDAAEDRRLTRRERQVVGLASFGRSDSIIAYTLGLSESTVQTHLSRALRKMGIEARAQLLELANMLGAVPE